ncbi:DUF2252 family protein [Modestobacter sp. VKM Ac-2982]|uniref:DUF2252 family protein n=1 Tax=Modestobacter sp. VKM Ac-2982 TaxID=3004136 RepID=UPI0022AB59BC|nr:DUF2252 family protein [Modestobacter sp. VKM Ac-2982]MCZ2852764.1 DUF2252 family protein [Modestobacter sp. VKM Ac-2982]
MERLVPVRVARMAASPYGFLRGTAVVMAADLAGLPATGIRPMICEDAHLGSVGSYASRGPEVGARQLEHVHRYHRPGGRRCGGFTGAAPEVAQPGTSRFPQQPGRPGVPHRPRPVGAMTRRLHPRGPTHGASPVSAGRLGWSGPGTRPRAAGPVPQHPAGQSRARTRMDRRRTSTQCGRRRRRPPTGPAPAADGWTRFPWGPGQRSTPHAAGSVASAGSEGSSSLAPAEAKSYRPLWL